MRTEKRGRLCLSVPVVQDKACADVSIGRAHGRSSLPLPASRLQSLDGERRAAPAQEKGLHGTLQNVPDVLEHPHFQGQAVMWTFCWWETGHHW